MFAHNKKHNVRLALTAMTLITAMGIGSFAKADENYVIQTAGKVFFEVRLHDNGQDELYYRPNPDSPYTKIFEGKINKFPETASMRQATPDHLKSRLLPKPATGDGTFKFNLGGHYALVDDTGAVIQLPKKYAANDPELYMVSKPFEYKSEQYRIISTQGQESMTALVRVRDQKMTYLAAKSVKQLIDNLGARLIKTVEQTNDKEKQKTTKEYKRLQELTGTDIDGFIRGATAKLSQTGILDIDFIPRNVDLEAFDEEATFTPGATREFRSSTEGVVDPVTVVSRDFRSVRGKTEEVPPIVLDRDKDNLVRIEETLLEPKSKAVVILGEKGTGRETLAMNYFKKLPRTWRILEVTPGALAAGATHAGEGSQKIEIMKLASRETPIIWYYKNISTLSGFGAHSANSNDIFNELIQPIEDGDMMVLATDTHQRWSQEFGGRPEVTGSFTMVKREALSPDDVQKQMTNWYHHNQLPEPKIKGEVANRISQLSKTFRPLASQPGRDIELVTRAFKMVRKGGKPARDLTLADIDAAAKELYDLDIALIDRANARKLLEEYDQYVADRMIGQSFLKSELKAAAKGSYTGMNGDEKAPAGGFFIIPGPPGVGKTEMAITHADALRRPKRIFEMNNYQTKEAAEKLLLEISDLLNANPFYVIILDEIEKAHPDVPVTLLKAVNDGIFTANKASGASGSKTTPVESSARLATFICTTNLAQDEIRLWKEHNYDKTTMNDNEILELRQAIITPNDMGRSLNSAFVDRARVVPAIPATKEEFAKLITLKVNSKLKFIRSQGLNVQWHDQAHFIDGLSSQFYRMTDESLQQAALLDKENKTRPEEFKINLPTISSREGIRQIQTLLTRKLDDAILDNPVFDKPETAATKMINIKTEQDAVHGVSCAINLEDFARL